MRLRLLLLALTFLPVCIRADEPSPRLYHTHWNDPDFIQRFSHDYLPHPVLEPAVSAAEQALFARIAPFVTKEPQRALTQLETARSANSSAALDYIAGNLHLQLGNVEAARGAYRSALEKFPSFLRAQRNLGLVEIQAGNLEAALAHLRQALQLGGGSAETYGLTGYAHLHSGQPAAAVAAYQQALIFQPESRDWRTGLVQALLETRAFTQAEALLDELIARHPEEAMLWRFQASIQLQQGRSSDALTSLEIAHRLAPPSQDSQLLLGDLYWQDGLFEVAAHHWLTALEHSADIPPQRVVPILSALASSAQWDLFEQFRAQLSAATIRSLAPSQKAEIEFLQAQRLHQAGDFLQAQALLEENLVTDPLHGKSLLLLAQIYIDAEELAFAELLCERAMRQQDYVPAALLLKARIQVAQRRFSAAIRSLEQAQQLHYRTDIADYLDALRLHHSRSVNIDDEPSRTPTKLDHPPSSTKE